MNCKKDLGEAWFLWHNILKYFKYILIKDLERISS